MTASGWRCPSECLPRSPNRSTDPLGELLGRYARTHGPFTTQAAAARFGLGLRVTADVLGRLAIDGRLIRGEFTELGADGDQWCDADVLKILRRRSLAALRAQVEPVSTAAYGRFLPAWQQVESHNSGVDGLASVIDQLAGVPIPASAVEPLVFGQRVRDYQPAMLDELLAAGEVTWSGAGQIGGGASGSDGWIAFHPADSAPLTLAAPTEIEFTDTHRAIMATLGSAAAAYFFRQLTDNPGEELKQALWELIWAGWITGDTFAPCGLDEIAERAGVSRALMYHYFPDKRAFFAAVVRAEGERLFEATNAPPEPGQSLFDQLREGVLAYLRYDEEHPHGAWAAYVGMGRSDPMLRGIEDIDNDRQANRIIGRITRGRRR